MAVERSSHSVVCCLCFSRNGEVLCSRKDFRMNSASIDLETGSVVLDAQALPAVQQQQQQARDANS